MPIIRVPLTRGLFADIDERDADYILGFTWRAKKDRNTWYAYTGHGPMKSMHAMVLMLHGRTVSKPMTIDHFNGNGLDNRYDNLKIITHLENVRKRRDGLMFPGVSLHKGRWRARIRQNGRRVEVNCPTQQAAIETYRQLAMELHGVEV